MFGLSCGVDQYYRRAAYIPFIFYTRMDQQHAFTRARSQMQSARNGKLVMEEYTAVNPTSQKETNFGLTGLDAYKFKFFSLEAMTTLR